MVDVKQSLVDELHKPARRNFKRRHVVQRGYDDLWQADLVEMIPYARENKGFRYMLTVIDTYSKYAWALPIKSKTADSVTNAFKTLLQDQSGSRGGGGGGGGRKPKNLQTDDGKEFYNREFQKFIHTHNINHYSSLTHLKASIVERFNRTLKAKMWKMFSFRGNYKWIDILQELLSQYNNSKHRTINMKPIDVKPTTHINNYNKMINVNLKTPKFKLNDQVRISKFKHTFEKGYTPTWTTEVFKIVEVNRGTVPVTYKLQDWEGNPIQGGFYEEELQKTKFPHIYLVEKIIRTRGDRCFVKWLGLDEKHNSWINKKDIV